jgi:hypothetical protein
MLIVKQNMSSEKDLNHKLEAVKCILQGLKAEDQEAFRSHLISWLLFSGPNDAPRRTFNLKGLTEKERDLIKRLSEQAERLNRLLDEGAFGESDQ